MKNRLIVLIALLSCIFAGTALADWRYLSVGVKLGYMFDRQGGLTFGGEVSYVRWRNERTIPYGVVFDLDGTTRHTKLHLGLEVAGPAGVDAGPTVVFRDGRPAVGLTITPFAWVFYAIPYYSHTFLPGPDIDEAGAYLKWPITLERGDPIVLW